MMNHHQLMVLTNCEGRKDLLTRSLILLSIHLRGGGSSAFVEAQSVEKYII